MQLSSRFPVAVQMLIIIAWLPKDFKVTSDVLAFSVNTNPVLIRRIMSSLKGVGLIAVAAGTGGARLTRPAAEISLLDVYRAVELTDQDRIFGLHENPNPACPIGKNVNRILRPHLDQARQELEASLQRVTIQQLLGDFPPCDPQKVLKIMNAREAFQAAQPPRLDFATRDGLD